MGIWLNVFYGNAREKSPFGSSYDFFNAPHKITIKSKCHLGTSSFPGLHSSLTHPDDYHHHNIAVALDGHIHNHAALCARLSLDKSSNGVAIAASLYRRCGHEGLYDLDGFFSLILYDKQKDTAILFRPLLTGHPIYYSAKNGFLSISTHPIDLLHRKDISSEINEVQIGCYLALETGLWSEPFFSDLSEVDQGEMVIITPQGQQSCRQPLQKTFRPVEYGSDQEAIETYRRLIDSTVSKHIETGRNYGIMLSSGIDSGALAALSAKQLKQQGRELRAYSWSLPNYPLADETEKIAALCKHIGIKLSTFDGEGHGPFASLDHLFLNPHIPFANLYQGLITQTYKHASSDNIDMMLNGHFGDELYRPSDSLFVDILKEGRCELFFPTLFSILRQAGVKNALKHSASLRGLLRYLFPFVTQKSSFRTPEWLTPEAKSHASRAWTKSKTISDQTYREFASSLAKRNALLGRSSFWAERCGMTRLEPYRDTELIGYTLRLPTHMIYRDGQRKFFAREAMRSLLPEEIRLQPRVGLLGEFATDSFMKHKTTIRDKLFDDAKSWRSFIDEQWMWRKFTEERPPQGKEMLAIWHALHLGPWQQAIRPGGGLYEGRFGRQKGSDR